MTQVSKEANATIDSLQLEAKQIMEMLGNDETSEENRARGQARLSDILLQMGNISKSGDAPVFLINLTAHRHIANRSYSSFWLKGKLPNEQYAVLEVTGRSAVLDAGRGGEAVGNGLGWRVKLDKYYIPAKDIADDLCREFNGDLPAISSTRQAAATFVKKTMGVFISQTRVPSKELLAKNILELKAYYSVLISEANAIWNKTKDYKLISDLHRDAAEYMGVSLPWHENLLSQEDCIGCGTKVKAGIAKCLHCNAILNEQLAIQLKMIPAIKVMVPATR